MRVSNCHVYPRSKRKLTPPPPTTRFLVTSASIAWWGGGRSPTGGCSGPRPYDEDRMRDNRVIAHCYDDSNIACCIPARNTVSALSGRADSDPFGPPGTAVSTSASALETVRGLVGSRVSEVTAKAGRLRSDYDRRTMSCSKEAPPKRGGGVQWWKGAHAPTSTTNSTCSLFRKIPSTDLEIPSPR